MKLSNVVFAKVTFLIFYGEEAGHIYFRGRSPVVIRLTCDCAVADDAVMPIRAESSS